MWMSYSIWEFIINDQTLIPLLIFDWDKDRNLLLMPFNDKSSDFFNCIFLSEFFLFIIHNKKYNSVYTIF